MAAMILKPTGGLVAELCFNKQYRDEGSLWSRQLDNHLKKHGLILNKPVGGSQV